MLTKNRECDSRLPLCPRTCILRRCCPGIELCPWRGTAGLNFGSQPFTIDAIVRSYSDIDEERERLMVTFSRNLRLDDIREMVSMSDKAGILHYQLLVDASRASLADLDGDPTEFQELLATLARISRLGKTAVFVGNEADLEIVNRLSAAAREWCEINVFLDPESARDWLGWGKS